MPGIKKSDSTPLEEIGTMPTENSPNINPNAKTLIDRYVFASNWCKGKDVLDWATGRGYGTFILYGLGAKSITGWDIDENTIKEANKRASSQLEIGFEYGDITLDYHNAIGDKLIKNYDVGVCLETFEHVHRSDAQTLLKNLQLFVKDSGKIIISTPQRHTPEFKYQGGTHLYEYSLNEFVQEISQVFSTFDIYYAVEFRHPASNELNTVFTKDPQWAKQAAVMIAVITNE